MILIAIKVKKNKVDSGSNNKMIINLTISNKFIKIIKTFYCFLYLNVETVELSRILTLKVFKINDKKVVRYNNGNRAKKIF